MIGVDEISSDVTADDNRGRIEEAERPLKELARDLLGLSSGEGGRLSRLPCPCRYYYINLYYLRVLL